MINRKKRISLLLTMALTCGMFMPAYATEIDDTKKKAEELENKKKTAESEKTSLANQLSNLVNEMEKTKKKISDKESEISNKEDELILAKAKENDQYESMKKRIRFMYENGNTGFIEILCSSKSIGEFLNNAEYISTISGYDRNMLVEFQKVVTDVENQEAELQKEYKQLQTMQDDLIAKQDNVNQLLTSKQSEIQKLDSELGDTKNKLAQLEAAAAAKTKKRQPKQRQQRKKCRQQRHLRIQVHLQVLPVRRLYQGMEHLPILVRPGISQVHLAIEHSRLQEQVRIIKELILPLQQEHQSMQRQREL